MLEICILCAKSTKPENRVGNFKASGVRKKFPRGAKVSSQPCDVTNQLGEC